MMKLRGLVLKNGQLEKVPSLPPVDRVTSLVDDECKLTPLSASFWDMDPPTGVFTRAYEELHYLDMILSKAASAHMAKEFMERSQLEDLAKGYSVLDEAERQQQQHDDMMRGALGKVGFEEYQKQNSGLYSGLGLGGGNTILDEIERQNVYGLGASNSVQDEIERLQAESANSLGFVPVGSALGEMERLITEADNSLGFGAVGSALGEIERLRTEPENSLGLGTVGSAFEEMERLRAEAGTHLGGIGAFEEMIRQRAEFDSSHAANGSLEAMEKQQKEFERSLGAGDGGGELEKAIRDQMNLNINPFDTLINKEVNRGDGEGFQTPFKKSIFDLPPPEILPLPKFEPPKLDKTDAVKEEEHKKHMETLAAGQKLYDLQLQAKNEQSERLHSLLEAQDRIVAVQERIVSVQERMEGSSAKTDRRMLWLSAATLLAALAALFSPFLAGLDISWGDYFSWVPEFKGWIVESFRVLITST